MSVAVSLPMTRSEAWETYYFFSAMHECGMDVIPTDLAVLPLKRPWETVVVGLVQGLQLTHSYVPLCSPRGWLEHACHSCWCFRVSILNWTSIKENNKKGKCWRRLCYCILWILQIIELAGNSASLSSFIICKTWCGSDVRPDHMLLLHFDPPLCVQLSQYRQYRLQ